MVYEQILNDRDFQHRPMVLIQVIFPLIAVAYELGSAYTPGKYKRSSLEISMLRECDPFRMSHNLSRLRLTRKFLCYL